SSRRRHTRSKRDWSSDVCSSDLIIALVNRLATGLLANLAIMMGLLAGFGVAIIFGMVDFNAVPEASWVAVTTPFHFGAPVFRLRSEERRVGREWRSEMRWDAADT